MFLLLFANLVFALVAFALNVRIAIYSESKVKICFTAIASICLLFAFCFVVLMFHHADLSNWALYMVAPLGLVSWPFAWFVPAILAENHEKQFRKKTKESVEILRLVEKEIEEKGFDT